MEVKQIYTILNPVNAEVLGESVILNEDLSNIVDNGVAVFNSNSFDRYSHGLVDKIGKMVFVSRPYRGLAPSVMMDGTTWGSVIQKVSSELPDYTENESFELANGTSYDPHIFNAPSVSDKFFAKYVTFEVDRSITRKQLESAFNGIAEMDAFLSMIFNEIEKVLTLALNNLVMRTINNFIGDTLYAEYSSGTIFGLASHVKAVNLLYLYNTQFSETLTADDCLTDPDFLRYASYIIGDYKNNLKGISTLFNIGGKERFTPEDEQHLILWSPFASASDVYLQSGTFHNELTAMPNYETVPYWQGTGTDNSFENRGKISVTTSNNHTVTCDYILGVLFDRYALGVYNLDRWVNTQYNAKADFENYFYKVKAGYFNDTNENFVVFFASDVTS